MWDYEVNQWKTSEITYAQVRVSLPKTQMRNFIADKGKIFLIFTKKQSFLQKFSVAHVKSYKKKYTTTSL